MKSDFGLAIHALVYLRHHGETISSEALADNICTNPARVRRVLSRLSHAGLLSTRRGRTGGGYAYPKEQEITLEQVVAALHVRFVETAWKSGDPGKDCRISAGMAGYMDGLCQTLDGLCCAHLRSLTISRVEKTLFPDGKGG